MAQMEGVMENISPFLEEKATTKHSCHQQGGKSNILGTEACRQVNGPTASSPGPPWCLLPCAQPLEGGAFQGDSSPHLCLPTPHFRALFS